MVWSRNDHWMVTADQTGYVKYWQSNMNNVKMFQAHKEPIRAIRCAPTDPSTGSGDVSLTCIRTIDPIVSNVTIITMVFAINSINFTSIYQISMLCEIKFGFWDKSLEIKSYHKSVTFVRFSTIGLINKITRNSKLSAISPSFRSYALFARSLHSTALEL